MIVFLVVLDRDKGVKLTSATLRSYLICNVEREK